MKVKVTHNLQSAISGSAFGARYTIPPEGLEFDDPKIAEAVVTDFMSTYAGGQDPRFSVEVLEITDEEAYKEYEKELEELEKEEE